MIKILHFGLSAALAKGVLNQLASERSAARMLSPEFSWDTKFFTLRQSEGDFVEAVSDGRRFGALYDYYALRSRAFAWLKQNRHRYDAVLLRYSCGDLIQYLNSAWFDNVFTVHHTFEIQEAKLAGGVRGTVKSSLEKELGARVLARTKGVIGVTGEIVRYEQARIAAAKPSCCYPNGIDLSRSAPITDRREGIPKLVMVASYFDEWHGLDLVIASLKMQPEPFELHVIGRAKEDDIASCHSDSRFLFHGLRDQSYVREICERCDLGLSCFALERKGMSEACTLKVREYLAWGLPVYAGHKDEALPESFPFYRRGQADAAALLRCALKWREAGREQVRAEATPFIDKRARMQELCSWLARQV